MNDLSLSVCRLHRWEWFTDSEGNTGRREVTVDHRSALADVLLGYDVPTGGILDEFERLVTDPTYEEDMSQSKRSGEATDARDRDPRPPVVRDKMEAPDWYDALDVGIRFPVKVLHAQGIDTCQSCEGGLGHSYPAPTVDLLGAASEVPGFAALHYLEAYGLAVKSLAQVWNVERGRIHEVVWRVELRRAHPERAEEWPIFVWGYR